MRIITVTVTYVDEVSHTPYVEGARSIYLADSDAVHVAKHYSHVMTLAGGAVEDALAHLLRRY